jgi:hypothetical protein
MASGHVNRIQKAEHMAAPTHAANVKKALANSEPSQTNDEKVLRSAYGGHSGHCIEGVEWPTLTLNRHKRENFAAMHRCPHHPMMC